MSKQPCFWDTEDRLKEISAKGDPLETLAEAVDFERFRPILEKAAGCLGSTHIGLWWVFPPVRFGVQDNRLFRGFPPLVFVVGFRGFCCPFFFSTRERGKPVDNPFLCCWRLSCSGHGLPTPFPHSRFSALRGVLRFWFFGALQAWKAMDNPFPRCSVVSGSGHGLPTLPTLCAWRRCFGDGEF